MRLKTLLLIGGAAYAWKRWKDSQAQSAYGSRRHQEEELDTALDDTFPASDPPAMTSPTSNTSSMGPDSLRRNKISH